MTEKIKAIGLISGGLDSILAATVIYNLGIEVIGLTFDIGSYSPNFKRSNTKRFSESLPFAVNVIGPSQNYLDMIVNPEHGYGKAVNPCIDCKIYMLKEARRKMLEVRASFVFTGEVLGQRPMSQNRQSLNVIESCSGLEGYLLRPLSAKLLPEIFAEKNGQIDRERLYDFNGRSRKRQIELASDLRISGFQQPAGGCFLTDKSFGKKFNDLLNRRKKKEISLEEIRALQVGRHLRISEDIKAIVGRNESENDFLENHRKNNILIRTADYPGASVVVEGQPDENTLIFLASVAAGYSDAKGEPIVRAVVLKNDKEIILSVSPALSEDIDKYMIL